MDENICFVFCKYIPLVRGKLKKIHYEKIQCLKREEIKNFSVECLDYQPFNPVEQKGGKFRSTSFQLSGESVDIATT